jgi:WD40 repeat protein
VVDIDSSLTGSVLAVGSVDQKVRIYDGVPPTPYTLRETLIISQSFTKAKISKDGGYLFIGTGDTVQIYEDQTGFVQIF